MSLTPGTRLGPYELIGALGAGGMGEVYRARDTKLGRDVALKVLPPSFADDAERRARFEREARTLAALNHPHIAQVYGFEERAATADAAAVRALVMELVPGESLAAGIARGPVPLREALELARQIADGLSAAHEKGIVHRDLKPANVQVTPEGVAKVLDFGLAKPVGLEAGGEDAENQDAATITSPAQLTVRGLILGTAAYMSPEQARGLAVDARADVWAFGALLYELLSGTRPFPGPSVTDTVAQILERDPHWTRLPATTPAAVRALIRRCLQKAPKQRLHDIADAKFAIEDALAALSSSMALGAPAGAGGAPGTTGAVAVAPSRAVWRHPLPLGLALLALALGSALLWSVTRAPDEPPREPHFLSLMLPPEQEMVLGGLEISPDGKDIVYSAVAEEGPPGPEGDTVRLFHRKLGDPASRPLQGTEHGWNPTFSPDGAWLAFTSKLDLKLKKVALSGGGTVEVADVPWFAASAYGGATWTGTGHILLGDTLGPVRQYPAGGGEGDVVVPRSALEGREQGTADPEALPGNAGILYHNNSLSAPQVAVWTGGQRRNLPMKGAVFPRVFGQHLLFWRSSGEGQYDLSAVRFAPDRGEVGGEPVTLLAGDRNGRVPFAVSDTGTLAYRAVNSLTVPARFTWLMRSDASVPPLRFSPPPVTNVARLSPDGRRLLWHGGGDSRGSRLAVTDLETGTTQVVTTGSAFWAVWLPDGRRVIYQVPPTTEGGAGLFEKPVDGSAPAKRLTTSKVWQQPQAVTADGRFLVYQESGGLGTRSSETEDNYDLWLLPLDPPGEPRPLLKTSANERLAHVSPDGRWMAYVSDQGGRDEIWVRSFPEGNADIQVSQTGGTEPVWAPDGGTLYYRNRTGSEIHALPVTRGVVPQFGAATVTTGFWEAGRGIGRMYDIHPSGQGLLLRSPTTLGREIKLVLNFDEVIRRKMANAK